MSSADPELDALLAPLRDGPIALSGASEASARRDRLLPAVRAEVQRAPARRRRARIVRRCAIGASAIGATATAALIAVALRGGGVEPGGAALRIEPLGERGLTFIDSSGMPSAIMASAAITAPGEIVAAPAAWSRLSTARGVHVDLAPRTRLRVTALQPRPRRSGLRLEQGEVHCRVPRLGPSEQFSIATPEADVIVHGTVFTVRVGAPDADGARATCVRVDEGLVEVKHRAGSVRLGPGAQWGCAAVTAAPQASPTASDSGTAPALRGGAAFGGTAPALRGGASLREQPQARRSARTPNAQPRRTAPPRRRLDGTLDEENRLLSAALGAEREQDRERARALFSTLLERHPASPLAPEARAGLDRTR
jgi:hypothetical protein